MTNGAVSEQPAEDDFVAKIGDRGITTDDVLECLIIGRNWKAIDECLEHFLLEEAFLKHNIATTQEEIRSHVTVFRQHNNLASGEDTHKWLEKHHMDDDDFLNMAVFELKLEKLKDLLFGKRVEEFFVYQRLELVEAELYKITLANEEAAREIVSSVKEGASFFDYARRYSIDHETAKSCGYMGKVKIKHLNPQVQDALSKSSVGSVVGPLKVNKNFEIFMLDSIHEPVFDAEMRQQLEDELFAQWLEDTKARSKMELFI